MQEFTKVRIYKTGSGTRKIFFETVKYGDELTKTGSGTRIYKDSVIAIIYKDGKHLQR